jgi:hypothetical protein
MLKQFFKELYKYVSGNFEIWEYIDENSFVIRKPNFKERISNCYWTIKLYLHCPEWRDTYK